MMADHYVANPGQECNEYLSSYPDRVHYMKGAWNRLLKEAFLHARDPFGRRAEVYIETHKDREWLLQAAVKAKDLVENESTASADAHYAAHPELEKFRKPAEFYFKPKQSNSGAKVATGTAAPAVQPPLPSSAAQATAGGCVGVKVNSVAATVDVYVVIAKLSAAMNPRELITGIKTLGTGMQACSGRALRFGVSVARDGVWEEDKKEDEEEL